MAEIGIRELKQQASEVIRRVREKKEVITITYRGRPVAKLVPVDYTRAESAAVWAEMDELARELEPYIAKDVSAVDAVSEQRREL